MEDKTILSVEGLKTYCFTRAGVVKAVDDVSFKVNQGDTLGLVGESGCGKSMTCNSIMRLEPKPAARILAGKLMFEGEDLLTKSEAEMRWIRGNRIAMILQDPLDSLNPVFKIGFQVSESFKLHGEGLASKELQQRAIQVLNDVNIPSAAQRLNDYPHQFSGGMRQRVVAAMALAVNPSLIIADEPTTALDVTIQDQFLRLLKQMQEKSGMGMILVTHDMGIVAEVCNRVVIMYAGRIMETGDVQELFDHPLHPYTEALLQALPTIGKRTKRLFQIDGEPPNLLDLPRGCSFEPRCHKAFQPCKDKSPPMVDLGEGRQVACWRIVKGEG